MPKPRICIFFSDTGGGHRSAAEALRAAIAEISESLPAPDRPELILDNVVEKSHLLSRIFVGFYNHLLKYHQTEMRHYYRFIQATRPNESGLFYHLVRGYGSWLIRKLRPQVIVSVHPMMNHFLARLIRDLGLKRRVQLLTVVTDPNEQLWKGWSCAGTDLILAPNDLARNRLVQLGTPPQRIKVVGMPVHPSFLKAPTISRRRFLSLLGLEPDVTTICVNAGWAGGGNMLEVYRALGMVKSKIQVIFLSGNNRVLFDKAENLARNSSVPTAVLPAYDCMSDLMSACDLMITKAGGLTTFECIARRLPMALDLITTAMPQERGTADMLVQQNLAAPLYESKDIVDVVQRKLGALKQRALSPPTAHNLDNIAAVYDIAQTILNACNTDYDLLGQPARAAQEPAAALAGVR